MEKDVFKFDDFINGDKFSDLQKMKSELIKEGLFSDREGYREEEEYDNGIFTNHIQKQDFEEDEEINQEFNPYNFSTKEETNDELDFVDKDEFNEVDEGEIEDFLNIDESKSDTEDYYKLFKDKSEDFICDIAVEGVNQDDTEVRLIIESSDWTLMFKGEVKNGKCIVPIKKLNIFNEGQTGNIKLEVNADGNLFTPWEDKFIIKTSKKVTIKLNENKKFGKDTKPKMGVKVNVKK